tara:strand:+ start:1094 stop:1480 length:387 start_codon:yes stop_codon:yes gene_type:complete
MINISKVNLKIYKMFHGRTKLSRDNMNYVTSIIGSLFYEYERLHAAQKHLLQRIDSLYYDIDNLNQTIIELNQDRERYVGLFKFFNNIQIIMKDGQTHYFDGDYNKFHQFISINLFDIQSITMKEKEQ